MQLQPKISFEIICIMSDTKAKKGLILALYFKMLSRALSELVLICNFFEETYICHFHACLLACFYEKHLTFLRSHIYFHLDNSELWKQYQSVSQEMMEQIYDLETVKSQETPIKVCVIFYNIEICYRVCGEKTSFSCNHLIYRNVS